MKVKSLSHVQLFATPWTVAYQGPLSTAFSWQEYWTRLPFPYPTTVEAGQTSVQWLTPPTSHPRQLMSNSFYRWRAGATGRNSAVSSDNHLETGHHWSDQCYLDCCQYSESSGPGYICFHFLGQFSELCQLLSWFPRRLSGKESACQIRRCEFAPSVGKIPERREWQLTAVFLPGESHGRRNLVGYSPWGHKEPLHFLSLCNSMHCSTPGFPVFHCLPGVC